jgi:cell division septation protein DedD
MIDLSKHIEVLLLKHDCVIVPGLGGFVTQYVSARYMPEEQLFLPPHRTVGFNAQLVVGDGLLAQSCMQAADISYPEALQLIDAAVEVWKTALQRDGVCSIEGIGVLRLGLDEHYDFTPVEAGVLSPDLYGLDGLALPSIARPAVTTSVTASRPAVSTPEAMKRPASVLLRGWVNYVAAAAVALVFYLLCATPVGAPDHASQLHVATMVPSVGEPAQPVATPMSQTPSVAVATSAVTAEEPTGASAPAATPETPASAETPAATEAPKSAEGRYTIVLASSIPLSNARHLAAQLQEDGMAQAEVLVGKRMVRVVYGHYISELEARSALKQLRKNTAYEDAWVMPTR